MRRPEHDFIQIAVADYMADAIEEQFPSFELRLMPDEMQTEGDFPTYILAIKDFPTVSDSETSTKKKR